MRKGKYCLWPVLCWSKDSIEADKCRLKGDAERQADTYEVKELSIESQDLKSIIANQDLEIEVPTNACVSTVGFKKYTRFTAREDQIIRLFLQLKMNV